MQVLEEKRKLNRQKDPGEPASLFTSICRPGLPGNTAVIKKLPVKFEKKQVFDKPADFSSWSMPAQEEGVIKCRKHEFW